MKRLVISPLPQLGPEAYGPGDLLLGPWCLDREGHSRMDAHLFPVLPAPWRTKGEIVTECKRLNALRFRLLDALAPFFNEIHATDHGKDFWKLILNSWLSEWLCFHWEIWNRLLAAQEHGNLSVTAFASTPYRVRNYGEFKANAYGATLWALSISNLLHVTEAMPWLAVDTVASPDIQDFTRRSQRKARIQSVSPQPLARRIADFLKQRSRTVVSDVFGIPAHKEIYLMLTSDPPGFLRPSNYTGTLRPSEEKRANSIDIPFSPDNEFEAAILALLKDALPLNTLQYEEGRFKHLPVVASGLDYTFNSREYYYAHLQDQGGKWFGVQHGCTYGMEYLPDPCAELEIVSNFITWGWSENDDDIHYTPLPAPMLGISLDGPETSRQDVLFLTSLVHTSAHTKLDVRPNMLDFLPEVLETRKTFLRSLTPEVRAETVLRPFIPANPKFDDITPIREAFPEIRIESNLDIDILAALDKTKLLVLDAFGTTFLRAMALGLPCVVLYEPRHNAHNQAFQSHIDTLRDLGVVITDPAEAARTVNRMWPDVKSWWNEPTRRRAITDFCANWAWRKKDWLHDWRDFLVGQKKALQKGNGA